MSSFIIKKYYKYITNRPYSFLVKGEFWPEFEAEHLKISHVKRGTKITIPEGYAWNGCSPKFVIADLEIGTPEGRLDWGTKLPITHNASLPHDVLYKYKHEHKITRKMADAFFLVRLKHEGFYWAKLYYYAVRAFGWLYNFSWNGKGITYKNWNKK